MAFDVPRQVDLAQALERESLPQAGDQMVGMDAGGVERALLATGRSRRQVAFGELGQTQGLATGADGGGGGGRLAVVLDELGDADAGKQLDQPLLDPHQQVFDLGGFRLGLLRRDLRSRNARVASPANRLHQGRLVPV